MARANTPRLVFEAIRDPAILEGYLTDASNVRGTAEALVRPRNQEQVAAVLAHCQAHGIPVTVTAGRTSTTAAAVPEGGWLLSTEGLGEVLSIGEHEASAEAGILLGAFQDQIAQTGRMYPPDPTSRYDCTLGASIACNASGARSFRYGNTRKWVEAIEVVLPDGTPMTVRRGDPIPASWPVPSWEEPSVKTAAGYPPPRSLLDLFIGQEGTLGVITQATVSLTAQPEGVIGLVAWFPDRAHAVSFCKAARAAARQDPHGGLSPRCIEYLDRHCLELARERFGDVPEQAQAALFCEQEVEGSVGEDGHLEAWLEALMEHEAFVDDTLVATDDAGRRALHTFRHAIPAGINEQIVRNGLPKVGTDLAVPDDALDAMMDAYEATPMEHVLFGHIGDNHLHLNLLPRTPDELTEARDHYDALAKRAIELGGTVSAEHGIGKLKRHHLAWMVGSEVLEGFRSLKAHLDPNWILGRGNLMHASESDSR